MLIIEPIIAITVEGKECSHTEIDTILLKVASRCNINCSYCYVYNMGDDNWSRMPKFMSIETIEAICSSLGMLSRYQAKPFSVVLHGGEPFLLGSSRLEHLLFSLRKILSYNYPISIQSNGVLLCNELLDICFKYRVTIAISIDGPENVHNKNRIGHDGKGSFGQVMDGIMLLKAHEEAAFLYSGLLAVIDPESNPLEVYQFFKSIQTPSVDFLYKDGNHDHLPKGKSAVNSIEYGSWMSSLLEIYLQDDNPIPIRVLDDMLKVLLGGTVTKEGVGVTDFTIIIIDTDGTIMKNDTLKSTFNGADKFQEYINVKDGNILEFINSPSFEMYRRMQQPLSNQCLTCPQLDICGGGMVLHRWGNKNNFDNPSIYCSDQLFLINGMRKALKKLTAPYV